ncbi:hypothetical protein COL26b_014493 [Colletotrichum chrysophilum]|uniref:uncharacterized protein n=1 Tax=Colletotrichum chrysophilum TaxID=1836956 RepID=UPI0022FFF137|nr:uncharacterized protein COL26b_014493 [Colletotrichum chrysophilum]KAJ0333751.1 hypothetical protein KNSL1_013728 [Colletotrichum chrysophilum]KAJ0358451.1 hypothetical protein COL26b_014493 [Colletotrichum chrysophilum]
MATSRENETLPPPSSQAPPPASQSHFGKFKNFIADDSAPFDHEFARLASSQEWLPGSQQYTTQRTIAMREELTSRYFPPMPLITDNNKRTERRLREQQLEGYQDLCREIGLPLGDSVDECKKSLKRTLVNIVDLIDARRTHSTVTVWQDFHKFRKYTLQDGHRIDKEEAKKGEGIFASLLQDFRLGRRQKARRGKSKPVVHKVVKGRVGRKCKR